MNTDTIHQLIVLGNGFDLHCGLHSSFYDFFEPRMKLVEKVDFMEGQEWVESLLNDGLTAWDLILRFRKLLADKGKDVEWCDVESAISHVVLMDVDTDGRKEPAEGDAVTLPGDDVTMRSIANYFAFVKDSPNPAGIKNHAGEPMAAFALNPKLVVGHLDTSSSSPIPNESSVRVAQFLEAAYPSKDSWSEDKVCDALFDELNRLEMAFNLYLGKEAANSPDYETKSELVLKELVSAGLQKWSGLNSQVDILNFNYTNPTLPRRLENTSGRIANIHGYLGSPEIIFGADGTGHMRDGRATRFSKTYRVARLRHGGTVSPIAYGRGGSLGGDMETLAIKFYGHSLAKADYAYFQSIFDTVDLYSGAACLHFFYTNYKDDAEEECLMRVARLLDSYGATLDNRDHGKNLMHKLLLEGRLVIEQLSVVVL